MPLQAERLDLVGAQQRCRSDGDDDEPERPEREDPSTDLGGYQSTRGLLRAVCVTLANRVRSG
jgi:hypothetical protein